jgi:hypothetical protein
LRLELAIWSNVYVANIKVPAKVYASKFSLIKKLIHVDHKLRMPIKGWHFFGALKLAACRSGYYHK